MLVIWMDHPIKFSYIARMSSSILYVVFGTTNPVIQHLVRVRHIYIYLGIQVYSKLLNPEVKIKLSVEYKGRHRYRCMEIQLIYCCKTNKVSSILMLNCCHE